MEQSLLCDRFAGCDFAVVREDDFGQALPISFRIFRMLLNSCLRRSPGAHPGQRYRGGMVADDVSAAFVIVRGGFRSDAREFVPFPTKVWPLPAQGTTGAGLDGAHWRLQVLSIALVCCSMSLRLFGDGLNSFQAILFPATCRDAILFAS